jgi:hypothetical protein
MSSSGLEPAIPATKLLQTYGVDSMAIGIDFSFNLMGCLGAHYVNVDRIIMNNELEGV